MLNFIISLLFLNYIPKEFQTLKRKAIKSSQLKLLSNENPEPMILPGKPFVTDSFIGNVLNPIFSITNKELKGYAISPNKDYIAIIPDRKTKSGLSILEPNCVFFGKNNITVSLTDKYADDGEVAIFNITQIDPLSAFYDFDMKLSSLEFKCSKSIGKTLGARCQGQFDQSWDPDKNQPKEIEIPGVSENIRKNVHIYLGANAKAEASAIIEKRGSSIQAKFDGSVKVLAGAGFHINQINYNKKSIEKLIDPITFGRGKVIIFGVPVELKASFLIKMAIEDLKFEVPHEITISRLISIDIHKGYTLSTKHGISPDFKKKIQIGTIKPDFTEKGDEADADSVKASFNASFSVTPAIKIELIVGSAISLAAEVGPKLGISVGMELDKEKCPFPGLYGSFVPFIKTSCVFSGALKIANIKLFEFKKPLEKDIYEKVLYADCFFSGSSSKELNKDMIQTERNRSVLEITNPKILDKNELYPISQAVFFFGANDIDSKPMYMGALPLFWKDDLSINSYGYIYIQESKNYKNLSIYTLFKNIGMKDETYDYPIQKETFISKPLTFDIAHIQSNDVSMSKEITIKNTNEMLNFQNEFIPSTIKMQEVSLILKTKKDGYYVNPNKYLIVDEATNIPEKKLYLWGKINLTSVIGDESAAILFYYYSFNYDEFELKSLNYYEYVGKDIPMENEFLNTDLTVNYPPNIKNSDVVAKIIMAKAGQQNGSEINLTYDDLRKTKPYTKNIGPYKLTFNSELGVNDIEYMVKINNVEVDTKDKLIGVIARTFEKRNENYEPEFYKGDQISIQIHMNEDEIYGVLKFNFNDVGYDIENNKNIFAFIEFPDGLILSSSSSNVDEANGYYAINLEYGKNVFSSNIYEDSYLITIPFRRRSVSKETLVATLYCIYQSYDNTDKEKDPYCPPFPKFSAKPNDNFYVGCVFTYLDSTDKIENLWKHYSKTDYKFEYADFPKNKNDNKPFSLLHAIKVAKTSISQQSESIVDVFAMRNYFNFPLNSRTMVIENETIQNLKEYLSDTQLEFICNRCDKIYKDSFKNGIELSKYGTVFSLSIDDIDSEFTLEAMCKYKSGTYCVFEYDISSDGVVLLEYNTKRDDDFNVNSKTILSDDENKLPTEYPGVEEIYDLKDDNDPLYKSRFNINCRRQIIPSRTGKIYLTKPWSGTITKVASNLENLNINIKVAHISSNGYVKIFMLGYGFQENPQSIPFNPYFLTLSDSEAKNELKKIGIDLSSKSVQNALDNKDIILDNDGNIEVKEGYFKENLLKNSINDNHIPLIGIPKGKYTLKYVKCAFHDKKKKCGSGKTTVKDENYDDEVCADDMSNIDIKSVFLGVETVFDDYKPAYKFIKNMRKIFGHIIPTPDLLHTGIWVGPSNPNNFTKGAILVYGNYQTNGKDSSYISIDGAQAYSMTLKDFIEKFDASQVKQLAIHRNITLFDLINEIKSSGKWRAKHYNWAVNNCQHFTKLCLKLLNTKRISPGEKDWIDLPRSILNTLEIIEKSNEN